MLQEMALHSTVAARNSNKIITKGENTDNAAIVVTSVPDTQTDCPKYSFLICTGKIHIWY